LFGYEVLELAGFIFDFSFYAAVVTAFVTFLEGGALVVDFLTGVASKSSSYSDI